MGSPTGGGAVEFDGGEGEGLDVGVVDEAVVVGVPRGVEGLTGLKVAGEVEGIADVASADVIGVGGGEGGHFEDFWVVRRGEFVPEDAGGEGNGGGDADLVQIVQALGGSGPLFGLGQYRKQHGREDRDDGDDDQQFNQRECGIA